VCARGSNRAAARGPSTSPLGVMRSAVPLVGFVVMIGAAAFPGCGVGCLYDEHGKVLVVAPNAQVAPERLIAVVADALQPLGFSGAPWNPTTPTPRRYWDYAFRNSGSGAFLNHRDPVDIRLKFDDASITLVDWSRDSEASEFDRRVTPAIRDQIRSELGADITFVHPKPPPFCLGP